MDFGRTLKRDEKEVSLRLLRNNTGEKGITLIELLVVMAIVAIMGLFMAPAIGEWLDNFRIRQAARDMALDLQFAKMKAISGIPSATNSEVYCTIVFNQVVGGTQYSYVVFPDYNNNFQLDAGNETTDIFRMVSLGKNISFDTAKGGGDGIDFTLVNGHPAIAFDRSGLPRDNNVPLINPESIYLVDTKNNKHEQLTISPAGRIGINAY